MSLRVSLRWQRTKTDANRRKPTKEDEIAKSQVGRGLREKSPSLLTFLEIGQKNPCLPANLATRLPNSIQSAEVDVQREWVRADRDREPALASRFALDEDFVRAEWDRRGVQRCLADARAVEPHFGGFRCGHREC